MIDNITQTKATVTEQLLFLEIGVNMRKYSFFFFLGSRTGSSGISSCIQWLRRHRGGQQTKGKKLQKDCDKIAKLFSAFQDPE